MATRIAAKSRPTKRPMVSYQYDLNGPALTVTTIHARIPRADKKAYDSAPIGVPSPVLTATTVVDTTP